MSYRRTNFDSIHPQIEINTRQTDKLRFISSLILKSTYERRIDISFHHLYWRLRQTGKKLFISLLILGFKKDRRTNYVSFDPQSTQYRQIIELRQTDKLFAPHILESTQDKQWKLRFISSFILKSTPDKWTTFNFTHHIVVLDRQTDKLRYILPSNWNLHKTDRRINYVSFHPSYWNPNKTERRTKIHFTPHNRVQRRTDAQTTLHLIPHIGIQVRQKDAQTTIHSTPYIVIYTRQTYGKTTFHFIPHSEI